MPLKKKTPSQQKFSTEIVFASPRGSPKLWLRQERVQVSHHFSKRPLHPAPTCSLHRTSAAAAAAFQRPSLNIEQSQKGLDIAGGFFWFPSLFQIRFNSNASFRQRPGMLHAAPVLPAPSHFLFYARTRMPSPMLDPSNLLQSKGLFKIPPILMHLGMFQLSRGQLLRLRHPLKVQQHAPWLFSPRQPRPLKRNRMSAV